MSGIAIEEIEAYAIGTRLAKWAAVGATTIVVRTPFKLVTGETTQLRLNPGESNEETVTVSSVQGREVVISTGLTYAHNAGEIVARQVQTSMIANRTRSFLVPPMADSAFLATPVQGMTMADSASTTIRGLFLVPDDFASGMTVKALVYCLSSGNIYSANYAYYGAAGQAYNEHEASTGAAAVAIIADQQAEIQSISLSSAAIGDYVRLQFIRSGANALDTLNTAAYIIGWLVEYTADS